MYIYIYIYIYIYLYRNNFIQVDIFFSQLKKQKVRQIKAYELTQFLGNKATVQF